MARRTIAESRRKLDRYVAALEAGMGPSLVATRTRAAQAEITSAQGVIEATLDVPAALTVDEVMAGLEGVRNLPGLLDHADIDVWAEVYRLPRAPTRLSP